jgi:hypothetical protein
MNMTILVALMVAWTAIFILKRVVRQLILRGAGRIVLTAVGKEALQRVPQQVSLQKTEWPQWPHASEVEQQAAPLRKEGFTDLGVYTVSTIPGVVIRMMAHPQSYVAAHIYDHPKSGSWTELVTRYNDGSSHALSTLPTTGMDRPDWVRGIQADKSTPTDQLYRQFLTQRDWHGIKPLAPEDTIREFEENYARISAWRQQRGITPEEVTHVAGGWLRKKQAAGAGQ